MQTGEYKINDPIKHYDLTKYNGSYCVYIIYIDNNTYKFGKSKGLETRLNTHRNNLKYNNIADIFEFPDENIMSRFERNIKQYAKDNGIYTKLETGIEFFKTTNEKTDRFNLI